MAQIRAGRVDPDQLYALAVEEATARQRAMVKPLTTLHRTLSREQRRKVVDAALADYDAMNEKIVALRAKAMEMRAKAMEMRAKSGVLAPPGSSSGERDSNDMLEARRASTRARIEAFAADDYDPASFVGDVTVTKAFFTRLADIGKLPPEGREEFAKGFGGAPQTSPPPAP